MRIERCPCESRNFIHNWARQGGLAIQLFHSLGRCEAHIPDVNSTSIRGTGNQAASERADALHNSRVSQRFQALSAAHAPNADRPVVRGAGEEAAVRSQRRNAQNGALVPGERLQALSAGHAPNADRSVLRSAGEEAAVSVPWGGK